MHARDVMTTKLISVSPESPVEEIARTLLEHRISAVPVLDSNGAILGIVSEGDLMRRSESETGQRDSWWLKMLSSAEAEAAEYVKRHGRRASDVMTWPVVTVDENATLEDVADILERRHIKRVPVLRDEHVVGIVSRANLLHGLVTAKGDGPGTSDDRKVRHSILKALEREAGVRDEFINVTVSDGVVHVWGIVLSDEEQAALRLVIENAQGVRGIVDHSSVLPPQVRSVLWTE